MKFAILFLVFITNLAMAKSTGIINITNPADGIFRGGRPLDKNELVQLSQMGIKSILNLQGGDTRNKIWKYIASYEPGELPENIELEKNLSEELGLNFINQPLNSMKPVTKDDDKRIDLALDFMNNSSNQPVYVHCEHGVDRTGLLIALYKVKYLKVNPKLAHQEWVSIGHGKKSRIVTNDLDKYFFKKIKEFK